MKICTKCILDTTIPEIKFDVEGICNYCKIHEELDKEYPQGEKGKKKLREIIKKIKKSGRNKNYDCIIGVSGGTDSSYMLYMAVKFGLRPLAVHFDNGWNSEIAVSNIKKICTKLNIDLYTYVVDWEEFKNLQISFLKASVPDAEIPTDVGLHGVLFRTARKEGIKYVMIGHSFRTEGVAPIGWTYMDGKYIMSVQKKFGQEKLKTFPNFTLFDFCFDQFIKGIKTVPLLNYLSYIKEDVKKELNKKLDWKYYGGHHHESIYTYFFQSYYLPTKFNIDKRKTEFSALIRSGQMTRPQALKKMGKYKYSKEIVEYTLNKLGLKKREFEKILKSENKTFMDYSTYYPLFKLLRLPIKIAYNFNMIPKLLYLKFSSLFS